MVDMLKQAIPQVDCTVTPQPGMTLRLQDNNNEKYVPVHDYSAPSLSNTAYSVVGGPTGTLFGTTTALLVDKVYLQPFRVGNLCRVGQVYMKVTTGAANAVAKVGIWRSDGQLQQGIFTANDYGQPGTLNVASGNTNADCSTTGVKTANFATGAGSVYLFPGRLYWMGVLATGAGFTLAAHSGIPQVYGYKVAQSDTVFAYRGHVVAMTGGATIDISAGVDEGTLEVPGLLVRGS